MPRPANKSTAQSDSVFQGFLAFKIIALLLLVANVSYGKEAYRVELQNISGTELNDVPVTFGFPFQEGELLPGEEMVARIIETDQAVPLQLDKKASHPDGSLRHGIFSLILPSAPRRATRTVELTRVAQTETGPSVTLEDFVASNASLSVELDIEGTDYVASLSEAMSNPLSQWLTGSIAGEWIMEAPIRRVSDNQSHPVLLARFYARKYAGDDHFKIDVIIENMSTFSGVRQAFNYSVNIRLNGATVYSKAEFKHYLNSRWKYTFWSNGISLGQNAPSVSPIHVRFDPTDLMGSGAVPVYNTDLIYRIENIDRGQTDVFPDDDLSNMDRYGPIRKRSYVTAATRR